MSLVYKLKKSDDFIHTQFLEDSKAAVDYDGMTFEEKDMVMLAVEVQTNYLFRWRETGDTTLTDEDAEVLAEARKILNQHLKEMT